jgi:uncharacterized membrane protein YphA (DoxX/SURF4 family)
MRRASHKPEETADRPASERLFAENAAARIRAVRSIISLALLAGMLLSLKLWLPLARSFPRAPLIASTPQTVVPIIEYLLSALLMATLIILALAKRPAKYLLAAITLLVLLIVLDQMRLQPWVYQYLLLFIVIALFERQSIDEGASKLCLSILQLIVAALYFWSGVQKLNYSFNHEVLPQLVAPMEISLPQTQLSALGIGISLVEIFTGCGLLLGRVRKFCLPLALAMHASVLLLLVWQGHNSVVWAWNVALMLVLVILFRRSRISVWRTFADWRAGDHFSRLARILAVMYAVLPALSFWGYWDMYLSGALYSGNTAVAVVHVDRATNERLPEAARRQVFATKSGELMLPVHEWALAELNAPPYPEPRVFKEVARKVCEMAENREQTELIMKERPATLSGSYKVTRLSCSQLDE